MTYKDEIYSESDIIAFLFIKSIIVCFNRPIRMQVLKFDQSRLSEAIFPRKIYEIQQVILLTLQQYLL